MQRMRVCMHLGTLFPTPAMDRVPRKISATGFCAAASAGQAGDEEGGWTYEYVPGAGDDEESWARGLTPSLLYTHQEVMLPSAQAIAQISSSEGLSEGKRGGIAALSSHHALAFSKGVTC